MSSKSSALVAGAGVAGLAAAKGLHDLGWQVHLVERRPAFDAVPTGLFVPASGMRAFTALGAAKTLFPCGQAISRLRLSSVSSDMQAVADLALVWPGIGPSIAMHRPRAMDSLLGWCPVPVRPGVGVQSLSHQGERVQVRLSDGSAEEYDLVIGADGAHSTVRGTLWPDAAARYGGESWWRGVVACPAGLEDWSACFCQEGTFLGMPIGGGLAYWAAGRYSAEPFDDPPRGRAARVRERFSDVTGIHSKILGQIEDDSQVQFSPAEEVWVEQPVQGRVVLLGDAAHATTPSMAQGASMAAEDALVLAQELAAAPGVGQALTRYASRRLPRTRHVQQATAMRNSLAALTLQDRTSFVIPKWAELSTGSFAALVPEP
jgi:2-polyprenyl-6-methoxyphenol hydroxylase-like FAD-dependent oxidoreductase